MQDIITAFRHFFTDYADQIAVVDPRKNAHFTYADIDDLSSRLASVLRPMVKPGGRVAFLMHNDIEIVLCYFACFQLQVTAIPINTALHKNEIDHTLAFAAPDVLITTQALLAKFAPLSISSLTFGDGALDAYSIAKINSEKPLSSLCFGAISGDFLALIMFTSGSTGIPKAIPIPFSRLIGHVKALNSTSLFGGYSRYYNVLPMSYIGGIQLLLCYFFSGSVFILDDVFSPRSCYRYWDTVLATKADSLWLTPTMASALLTIGLETDDMRHMITTHVKRSVIAMGAIATDVKQRFEAVFGIALQKSFGITETLLCCHWNDDVGTPVESVGKPLPGVEVVIMDEDQYLPQGEEGEIGIGGAWVLDGYWHQPELDAVTFNHDGYFKTGDLGHIDTEGHVFITGRIKDMIKCGGLNVAPAEIEALMSGIKGVKEVAVIGIPDEFYGERIIAFVTEQPSVTLNSEEALRFCRSHLTAQKVPSEIRVRAAFPMNAVGKINKRALKEEMRLEAGHKA